MRRAVTAALTAAIVGAWAVPAWCQPVRDTIAVWDPPENGWLILEDFSGMALGNKPVAWAPFGTSDQAKAQIAVVDTADKGREGRALVLRGPLMPDTQREIVEAARWLPLPMVADGIALTVHGDSRGHDLFVRLEDSQDETFQYRLGAVQADGWERRVVVFDQAAAEVSWGEKKNGVLDYPLRYKSIGLTTSDTGQRQGEFEVLVTDLAVGLGDTSPLPIYAQTYGTLRDKQPWRLVQELAHVAAGIVLKEAGGRIFPVVSYH